MVSTRASERRADTAGQFLARDAFLGRPVTNLVGAFIRSGLPSAETFALAPGSGAAGGVGFAAMLLGATVVSGAEYFLDLLNFDALIRDADLVVTGEGRLEHQTLHGKLPAVVAMRGAPTPVIAVAGRNGLDADAVTTHFATLRRRLRRCRSRPPQDSFSASVPRSASAMRRQPESAPAV